MFSQPDKMALLGHQKVQYGPTVVT